MIQGAALGFVFVPLTTITNGPIPNERMGNATSIFNLMRNIGASIGISMVETVQFRKQQTHINILGEHVYPQSGVARHMMESMKAHFMSQGSSAATATRQAYGAIWGTVQHQAAMLAYDDTFLFLAFIFVAMIPFLLLLRKPRRDKGGAVMMH
jgi:DHA2 family multidrug resistance protein